MLEILVSTFIIFFQSLFAEPLSTQSNSVQVLKGLWEKTQLKGTHSFETAMIQSTFPHQKVSFIFFSSEQNNSRRTLPWLLDQLYKDLYNSYSKSLQKPKLFSLPLPFLYLSSDVFQAFALPDMPSPLLLDGHMVTHGACLWPPLLYDALSLWGGRKTFTSCCIFNLHRRSTVLGCAVLWKVSRLVLHPLLHASCGLFLMWWKLVMLHAAFFLLTVSNSRSRWAATMDCLAATWKFT